MIWGYHYFWKHPYIYICIYIYYIYIYCSARHRPAGTRDGTQLMHSEETLKKNMAESLLIDVPGT